MSEPPILDAKPIEIDGRTVYETRTSPGRPAGGHSRPAATWRLRLRRFVLTVSLGLLAGLVALFTLFVLLPLTVLSALFGARGPRPR